MTGPKPVKIRCDACPVMCYVAEGMTGACDRYANEGGRIVRCDPLTVRAGGEFTVKHGDTVYLTPQAEHIHKFDDKGLRVEQFILMTEPK